MKDAPVTKEKFRPLRFLSPRGGALIEISAINIKIVAQVMLSFLAEKGLLAGLAAGGAVVINKIPATAVSAYLRDGISTELARLGKKEIAQSVLTKYLNLNTPFEFLYYDEKFN